MTCYSCYFNYHRYVIHTNKNNMNRAHLTTLHGKLGAAVVVSYFLVGIAGKIYILKRLFRVILILTRWHILKS